MREELTYLDLELFASLAAVAGLRMGSARFELPGSVLDATCNLSNQRDGMFTHSQSRAWEDGDSEILVRRTALLRGKTGTCILKCYSFPTCLQ